MRHSDVFVLACSLKLGLVIRPLHVALGSPYREVAVVFKPLQPSAMFACFFFGLLEQFASLHRSSNEISLTDGGEFSVSGGFGGSHQTVLTTGHRCMFGLNALSEFSQGPIFGPRPLDNGR